MNKDTPAVMSAENAIERCCKSFIEKTKDLLPDLEKHFNSTNDGNYLLMATTALTFFPSEDEDVIKRGLVAILAVRKQDNELTTEQTDALIPIIAKHIRVLLKILK